MVRYQLTNNYSYQILLSLVRSNVQGNIGFLEIENRVCVALSRARRGLYVSTISWGSLPLIWTISFIGTPLNCLVARNVASKQVC